MSKYDQLPQWIQSQNGSDFCPLNDVAKEVKSQLRQEDKYTITIHGFRYTVKDYEGKWLVFRSASANTVTHSIQEDGYGGILILCDNCIKKFPREVTHKSEKTIDRSSNQYVPISRVRIDQSKSGRSKL